MAEPYRGLLSMFDMKQPGNIDLASRKQFSNPDGSFSTLRSMSFGTPQGETLVPTVRPDGWYMSPHEAIARFYQTGQHLGMFDSPQRANEFAALLSALQGGR